MSELIPALESWGGALAAWIAGMTLWTGALLAAALVLDLALRRRVAASWRMMLPALVLVRLALPADWQSPIAPWGRHAAPAPAATAATVTTATVGSSAPAAASAPAAPRATWRSAVAIAYPAGLLALVGGWVLARASVARRAASARPARPALARLLPDVPLWEHDALGPSVVGVLRPRVLVPASLADRLSPEELADVLAHERAHVRRRDPWLAAALQLVTIAAWPILPAWLATRRLRALMEEACDEAALAGATEERRTAYGRTLLAVADHAGAVRPRLAVGLLPFAQALRARLAALRHARRWPVTLQAVPMLVIAPVLLLLAGVPKAAVPPDLVLDLDRGGYDGAPISLHYKDADCGDLIRMFNIISGWEIQKDNDLRAGTITIELDDVPWDQALALILKTKQLRLVVREGHLLVVKEADVRPDPGEEGETTAEALLYYGEDAAAAASAQRAARAAVSARGSVELQHGEKDYLVRLRDVQWRLDALNTVLSAMSPAAKANVPKPTAIAATPGEIAVSFTTRYLCEAAVYRVPLAVAREWGVGPGADGTWVAGLRQLADDEVPKVRDLVQRAGVTLLANPRVLVLDGQKASVETSLDGAGEAGHVVLDITPHGTESGVEVETEVRIDPSISNKARSGAPVLLFVARNGEPDMAGLALVTVKAQE